MRKAPSLAQTAHTTKHQKQQLHSTLCLLQFTRFTSEGEWHIMLMFKCEKNAELLDKASYIHLMFNFAFLYIRHCSQDIIISHVLV